MIFDSIVAFEEYVIDFLLKRNASGAVCYFKYAYSKEQLNIEYYECQFCGLFNNNELNWFIDWYEGQQWIELKTIITENDLTRIIDEGGFKINE